VNGTDWYFTDWMQHLGKRQVDLVRELGWTRRKASEVYNGDQQYKRDVVNEIALWMKIEPFELLMPPSRALALRRFQNMAVAIAADIPSSG